MILLVILLPLLDTLPPAPSLLTPPQQPRTLYYTSPNPLLGVQPVPADWLTDTLVRSPFIPPRVRPLPGPAQCVRRQ